MKVTPTSLSDVLILEPSVFSDERGYFVEIFNQREFAVAVGQEITFVQDNQSCSHAGVMRGLHYQVPPHAQGKLVRVARGRAFDVAVDIRRGSPTYTRWVGLTLDAREHRHLWIPPGFAHGFLALEDATLFVYKTTDYYDRRCERSIAWDDPDIGIRWPTIGRIRMAPKDAVAPRLVDAEH